MFVRTEDVEIKGYSVWNIDGKDSTRRDGSLVEYVEYLAPGELETRRATLAARINGSRPPVGAFAALDVEQVPKATQMYGEGGRPYIGKKDRLMVHALHVAKAA